MSSSRSSAVRVLHLREKDKHAAWLGGLAHEVNTVFDFCNELSVKVFERQRRFLSGFDFWPFLKGATRGECALHLPIQSVQEIAEEYARRSPGWIPFKVRTIRYRGGRVYFAGDLYDWWPERHTGYVAYPLLDEWCQRDFAGTTVIPMYKRLHGQEKSPRNP